MKTIRAKFRCLSITKTWEGITVVKLGPVKRSGNKDAENDFFWRYTPSGEIELTFAKGKPAPFAPGDYFYVDLEPNAAGLWSINGIEQTTGNTNVTICCHSDGELGLQWGNVKLGLSPEATGACETLQPFGSTWSIKFTFAEASDASGLYS